jgi:hypothetical protein
MIIEMDRARQASEATRPSRAIPTSGARSARAILTMSLAVLLVGLGGAGRALAQQPQTPPPAEPASDHDAVVGHWGIEARRLASVPYGLALRPDSGCPLLGPAPAATVTPPPPCTVDLGAISVRHWRSRTLAINAGLVFGAGGGQQGARTLDTYFGVGPIVGLTLLLGNWRHLAIGASPELSYVYFRPSGGGSSSTTLIDLRAQLEGELHFGFVGVPALSVGIAAGLLFRYESTPDVSIWTVSINDGSTVWGTLTNLFIRYYL